MVADFPLNKWSRREPGGCWDASNASAHITSHPFSRVLCCCSVAKLCPTLSDPLDCSTPGCSVLHYLLKFAPVHVHTWVSDAIQPSSSSSVTPFAFSLPSIWSFPLSQLFTSGGQSIRASAWVLPMNTRGCYPVGLTGLISVEEFYTWGCEYPNMALTGVWLLVSSVALRAPGSFISDLLYVIFPSFPLCTSQFVEHSFSLYCVEITCVKFYFHLLFWALGWHFQSINLHSLLGNFLMLLCL